MKIVDDVVGFVANVTKIPGDKLLHCAAGALIAGIALAVTHGANAMEVLFLVLLAGVAKECYDGLANVITGKDVHTVDLFDILATFIGGVIVVGVLSLI